MHEHLDKQAQNVVQLLYTRKLTLTTAESCTGGLLSGAVTAVSGSSQVFGLGVTAYANEVKTQLLGVSPEVIEKYGAVSAECAAEMAQGAIRRGDYQSSGASETVGISVTGIAGPDGGTPQKPVGTVFIACAYRDKIKTLHLKIKSDNRQYIRLESVRQALVLILNTME
jgi:PncC family amidohydrolase